MNGLREIREYIKSFICGREQTQKQIVEIEEQRAQLANERNEKKKIYGNNIEVSDLGNQISDLGNQSQKLQNQIDASFYETKLQVNLMIDNFVAEGIRKIRKVNEEIQELENKNKAYAERKEKYELQKHEFFVRFGRKPELSETAKKQSKLQEKETLRNTFEIKKLEVQVEAIETEIKELVTAKREVKNGNWNFIINSVEELYVEDVTVNELEPIHEFYVEEFQPIEELYIEPFEPIEEIQIEEVKIEEFDEYAKTPETKINEKANDEIEEIAKAIIEEIAAEQAKFANVKEIEEDIFANEEKIEKKEKVIIPLFGQRATISGIVVNFEDAELLYKAQMSDGEEIKIYPAKLSSENVLLRDKQNREECREILINYAINEHKTFDKNVVNKIDPLICELLIECAEEYGYDAQELIFDYAMTFSKNREINLDSVPGIIYNFSYIEDSKLTRKEKLILNQICRKARKNEKIEIIESFAGFKKIKYLFKKLFAITNVKVLPEAKY